MSKKQQEEKAGNSGIVQDYAIYYRAQPRPLKACEAG